MRKKGNILTENIVFIVINLVFLVILGLFLFSKAGDASSVEERYAKQIAMMIDYSEAEMILELNMKDAAEQAKKENFNFNDAVSINENVVIVKLRDGKGYSYSFFNNVDAKAYSKDGEKYVFTIAKK